MVILQQFKIMQEHLQQLNHPLHKRGAINPGDKYCNTDISRGGALSPDQFYGTKPSKILQFPSDVANPDPGIGNHGHYIMFYINEQDGKHS